MYMHTHTHTHRRSCKRKFKLHRAILYSTPFLFFSPCFSSSLLRFEHFSYYLFYYLFFCFLLLDFFILLLFVVLFFFYSLNFLLLFPGHVLSSHRVYLWYFCAKSKPGKLSLVFLIVNTSTVECKVIRINFALLNQTIYSRVQEIISRMLRWDSCWSFLCNIRVEIELSRYDTKQIAADGISNTIEFVSPCVYLI